MTDDAFVGRRDELARFSALLGDLAADAKSAGWRWHRRKPASEGGAAVGGSRVVLVHGLGGSGKSRLLRQFREMALGNVPVQALPIDGIQVAWLDWEDEHRDDPGLYAGVAGPSLVTVLNAVQKVVIDAAGGGSGT